MYHGMVDQNVHFQDIAKVSQRLIEIGKNNWELVLYRWKITILEIHQVGQMNTKEFTNCLKRF